MDEFETSKEKLNELIAVNRQNYLGAKEILGYTANPNTLTDEKKLSHLLLQSLSYDIHFNANNSLLNEMISSGSLKDISNNRLRVLLTNWSAMIEDIARQEHDLDTQRKKTIDIFRQEPYSIKTLFVHTNGPLRNNLNLSGQATSNLSLLRSLAFENNILMFYLSSQATEESHYLPLLNKLNAILDLINKEIE